MKKEVIVIVGVFLIICCLQDIKKRTIPWLLPVIFGVAGIVRQVMIVPIIWQDCLIGAGLGVAVLALGYLTQEAIGYGDGMIIFTTGIYLGFYGNLALLFYGLVFSSLGGLLLMCRGRGRKARLPFAPFLTGSFLLITWLGI